MSTANLPAHRTKVPKNRGLFSANGINPARHDGDGGGPGRATQSVALNIYEEAFKGNIRYGYATAKSTVLFVIVLVVTAIQLKVTSRKEQEL